MNQFRIKIRSGLSLSDFISPQICFRQVRSPVGRHQVGEGIDVWNLILAGVSIALSFVAMNRSILRRRWFYLGIFETVTAQQLLQEKWVVDNRQQDSKYVEPSKLEIAEKQPASPRAQIKSKK